MNYIRPVLAQYASPARITTTLPGNSHVDPLDSMLRIPGLNRPLIESVLAREMPHANMLDTTLSAARNDPIDPDLIRAAEMILSTVITRAEGETSDPDLARFDTVQALSTLMTKSEEDPSDPDTVRMLASS